MSISITASRDDLQRVSIVSNDHSRAFVSSSKQSDQRELRSLDIQSLLNPVEDENRSNESSAVDSLSLSKLSTDLSVSSRSHVHNLLSTKSSSYRQVNQETSYSQTQNREHSRAVNFESLQPTSQRDSLRTQYSSYNHFSQTESAIAPLAVSISQSQYFFSNLSSDFSSTMMQMLSSEKIFEMLTSSTTMQSQYQAMTLKTERDLVQISVDVHTASKDADVKRLRNAKVSHRFRQRRKEKEQKTSKKIVRLEVERDHYREERDHYREKRAHYRGERDYFRHLAFRHGLFVAPRPSTPKRQRHTAASPLQINTFQCIS
jgi:hypothetical protein